MRKHFLSNEESKRCLQHNSKWLLLLSKDGSLKEKMGLTVFKSRHLVTPRRKHFILLRMFLQPFCLQRATSPVAQEIGQLRYRLSSKSQSWLLAQIRAVSFPFALWKQLCHLAARQMLPSGTLCLAPKSGIWLHLPHRHLALKPAAGTLA